MATLLKPPKHLTLKMEQDKNALLKDIAKQHGLSLSVLIDLILNNFVEDFQKGKVAIKTDVALVPVNVNPSDDTSVTIQP